MLKARRNRTHIIFSANLQRRAKVKNKEHIVTTDTHTHTHTVIIIIIGNIITITAIITPGLFRLLFVPCVGMDPLFRLLFVP